jgi:hypothetical protein
MSSIEGHPGKELAAFYARRMADGFGPKAARRAGRKKAEAEAAGDGARARFWESVLRRLGGAGARPR